MCKFSESMRESSTCSTPWSLRVNQRVWVFQDQCISVGGKASDPSLHVQHPCNWFILFGLPGGTLPSRFRRRRYGRTRVPSVVRSSMNPLLSAGSLPLFPVVTAASLTFTLRVPPADSTVPISCSSAKILWEDDLATSSSSSRVGSQCTTRTRTLDPRRFGPVTELCSSVWCDSFYCRFYCVFTSFMAFVSGCVSHRSMCLRRSAWALPW